MGRPHSGGGSELSLRPGWGVRGPGLREDGVRGQGQGCGAAGSGWRGGLRPEGETQHAAPDFGKVSPSLRELQKQSNKGILSQLLGCGVQAGRERDGRPLPPVAWGQHHQATSIHQLGP